MKNFRSKKGSVINEEETIKFSFDGNEFSGFKGDTLSSALLSAFGSISIVRFFT